MLKRRTILLLAAVMTLGAAFALPSVSTDHGAEVCAIVWLAEQQCERQEVRFADSRECCGCCRGGLCSLAVASGSWVHMAGKLSASSNLLLS